MKWITYQLNSNEGLVSSVVGMISSVLFGSMISIITDLLMAFGVGLMGAVGGLAAKALWDYLKSRLRR